MPYKSLYDTYRLSNSSAIPLYEGSTGQEALQVGSFRQGQYDNALGTAGEIGSMAQNVQAMQKDQSLAQELSQNVDNKIKDWSARKDWENYVEPVKALGREYVNRAKELAAPIQQYQDWKKNELEDDKKGLTPFQKKMMESMALDEYQGLKKDPTGRYIGSFTGRGVAKNIDEKKFADDAMQGYVDAQGGTDISTDDGITKYRKGNEWHILTPERVKRILSDARSNSLEYGAYSNQEGDIHGYVAKKSIRSLDQVTDPVAKANAQALIKYGYEPATAVAMAIKDSRQRTIANTMDDYAITKYAHNNQKSISEQGIGDVEKARRIKKLEEDAVTTTVNEGPLDNPVVNWNDLQKGKSTASTGLSDAAQNINKIKNIAGKDYDQKNGTGAWAKLVPAQQEQQLHDYFIKTPGGETTLKDLYNSRATYAARKAELDNLAGAEQVVKNKALQSLGYSSDTWDNKQRERLSTGLSNSSQVYATIGGKSMLVNAADIKAALPGAKISTRTVTDAMGEVSRTKHLMDIKTSDGRTITIDAESRENGKIAGAILGSYKENEKLAEVSKKYADDALKNYSQSTAVVSSNSKPFNDLMTNSIKASAKKVFDMSGKEIPAGSDEAKEAIDQINAGNFTLIGSQVENKANQNSMFVISVQDKSSKDAEPKTYRIGTNSTSPNLQGQQLIRSAVNKAGQIVDVGTYEAGKAMLSGSAYRKIIQGNIGTVAKVMKKGADGSWQPYIKVDKAGTNTALTIDGKVVPNMSQMSIGTLIDEHKGDPNFKIEF